jgi:hypothetical protein
MIGDFERIKLHMWGRSFVPPEGRDEFTHPTYWSKRDRPVQGPGADTLSPGSRHIAAKLFLMAVVMIGLLLAVIALFT